MTKCLSVTALLFALTAAVAAQQLETTVVVTAAGIQRASFVPRPAPYFTGGPSVAVYLFDRQDVRTSDGLAVTGFEFIGWTEGDATRVQVFALVPMKGAPNTYLPEGNGELLERRDFASYRIPLDQGIAIGEMRTLGIEPMILGSRQVPQNPIAIALERMRELSERMQKIRQ